MYLKFICKNKKEAGPGRTTEVSKTYKKHYIMTRKKPRRLEGGDQVLILLHVGANDYRVKMRSKTKMYHVNVLKKYIAKEPEADVVHTSNKDDATITVARVVHQDTESELEKVPDLEVKLGEDLSEDQHCKLKDLIRRYRDVFTDMPRETDVIQHSEAER